ncbi:hypothetical protein [Kribbella italica]|uniref:Uncharacterized protein n=1 Tax=Kribbella italica TaxID=1540520 RepID=A0A7W9MVR2_9ACTN|nr:hypothetical protein [Kribbella italica]MBB5837273.1 hypothetical protein [Kribbella italica]
MRDDRLPEPAELHAHLSRRYRLDWGDLPDRQSIVAEFGVNATERSLALLARAARVEPRVTADMLASMDGAMFRTTSRIA